MAREDQIIIEVEVDAGASAERLASIRARLDELTAANKSMRKEQREMNAVLAAGGTLTAEQARLLKDNAAAMARNAAEIKELTAAEKMETAQVQISTQNDRKYGDSIVELGAQLAQLKSEYRGLSKAQREGAEGQALLRSIQQLDGAVKQADYSLGDHQRNVGNYVSALTGLNGNVLQVANLFAGGFRRGLSAATTALKTFGKTLLTTPIGWISGAIAAAVAVFRQLQAAFQRNDAAGTKLSAAFKRLTPVVTAVKEAFNALATVVATVVDGISRAAVAVVSFFVPSMKDAAEAAAAAEVRLDVLQEAERNYTVAAAERANRRAKLEEKARYAENLSAKERIALLEQSRDLALKDLEEDRRIKKEKLDLLVEEQKRTADYSDAMADRIAQARAAYISSETEMVTGTRRLNAQLKTQREELESERKAAARAAEEQRRAASEAAKRAAEERARRLKTQGDEVRALEDLMVQSIKDEYQRSRQEMQLNYSRRIEDLRERMESEEDLTVKAREAIEGQIAQLQKQSAEELARFDEQAAEERMKRQIEISRATVDARIAAMEDAAEREIAAERVASERRVSALRERLEKEKDLTVEERAGIAEQIAMAEAAAERKVAEITAKARQDAIKGEFARMSQELDNRLNESLLKVGDNAAQAASIRVSAAAEALRRLMEMDAETKAAMFENEESYTAAVIAAQKEVAGARKESGEALQAQAREIGETMQEVTGALGDLFEAAAGDSEAYEKFKKAMAIVDAMISMATTIAAATAVSVEGDPYTMAVRIAANVAAVTAQFAAVIKAIKAAAVPSAPSFETGGIVPGSSWSGDRVVSRLNSGEMVINRADQQRLWELVSTGMPVQGMDYGLMAAAFADAVSQLPAPVLDYSEFTRFERKVRNIENLTKIN